MNVCFLLPPNEFYSPTAGGGIAAKTMQQARRLIARAHDVTIVTPAPPDPAYPVGRVVPIYCPTQNSLNVLRRGLSIYRRKVNRWEWLYYEHYLRSMRWALRGLEKRPEAVLVFNDLITPRYVKKALPDARVLCILSNECRAYAKHVRKSIAATHKFICVSKYIQDWTVKEYGLAPERIATIANGADPESFQPRSSYLATSAPLRVLYVGRIDPTKGPDLAVDAVAQLRHDGVAVSLTVAGDMRFGRNGDSTDPYYVSLKKKMSDAGAEFLGHLPRRDVPQVVRRHDVACILSRGNDPMSQTALEAMASGLAVLASDRGGIPEACAGAGWLVNPDDFNSIVSALRTLATIPPVLNEFKRRSVARAARATWDVTVEALENVLKA